MKKITFLIAAFVLFTARLSIGQQPEPVKVDGGLLQGPSEGGLAVYRGIPFAAPPIGDLRWRAPQPAAKWDGVKLATKFAPGPISSFGQFPEFSKSPQMGWNY